MFDDICEVLCSVFEVEKSQITPATSKQDLDEWDSMKQLELITELEKKFSVKFSMDEMISIDSVAKIKEALEKRKVN
jgi:acyl carrier protein